MPEAIIDRKYYRPDQRIPILGIPLLVCVPIVAAAGVAWALQFLFVHEWYLIFLVPFFGGMALGGILLLLVGLTHCRNSWLAGSIVAVCGAIGFLGYYYLCLVNLLPPGNAHRVGLLPRYIYVRLKTDVAVDVGRPQVGNQPKKPFVALNVMTFAVELGIIAICPAAIGWRRSRRAYCADLSQWMVQEKALLPPSTGQLIAQGFKSGRLEEVLPKTTATVDPQAATILVIEHAQPLDASPVSFPMYATVKDQLARKSWYWRGQQAQRTRLSQVELMPSEILALRRFFPKLSLLLESHHEELRELPASVLPGLEAIQATEEIAIITPVPEPYRQRVRTPSYAVKVNLIGLVPVVFILAGIGLVALGVYLCFHDQISLSIGPFIVGGPSLAWGIYVGGYCMGAYENRWVNRQLRAEIQSRPDPLIDPADPNALSVSLIPRENWTRVKWTLASDLLLMRIDGKRREILLEGDSDRFRIPAGAIAVCEPQCFFHPIDKNHNNELWMVRLMVRAQEGMRELLLSVAQSGWRPRTNASRLRIAKETCDQITAMQQDS